MSSTQYWYDPDYFFGKLRHQGLIDENGMFNDGNKEWPVIYYMTKVDDGVFLTPSKQKSILVDFENDKEIQNLYDITKNLYRDYLDEYHTKFGDSKYKKYESHLNEFAILRAVYKTVRDTFFSDDRSTSEIKNLINKIENDDYKDKKVVPLGVYIKKRVGDCRINSLSAADLLEKFIKEGYLNGNISVDFAQSYKNNDNYDYIDGHAWVRYTSEVAPEKKKIFIVDPAMGFSGPIDKTPDNWDWNYYRPDEITNIPGAEELSFLFSMSSRTGYKGLEVASKSNSNAATG
ncbi:MAG: hypothetical protein GWP09_01210 [Nitrospiraceae bacterium]|nr:hypothetical protein [Nitrospiraceae bacterium]